MAFTTAILVKLIPRQNKSLTSKTVIVCRMLASPQTIAISPISGVRYMVYRASQALPLLVIRTLALHGLVVLLMCE